MWRLANDEKENFGTASDGRFGHKNAGMMYLTWKYSPKVILWLLVSGEHVDIVN